MKRICSVILTLLLALLLNGCSDSSNQTDAISGAGDEKAVATSETSEQANSDNTAEYKKMDTYKSYGTRNGGRQAWRIPKKGPAFGKKIKVVFSNGHTVYVNNTSRNYREGDGFVFKPGLGPNGHGVNNTGTAHSGVYLHAPYGNRSKLVKFYYN